MTASSPAQPRPADPTPPATEPMRCTECAEPVESAHRFCEACGTELGFREGGTAHDADRDGASVGQACHGCGAEPPDDPAEEYCPDCGLRRRDGTDRVETDLGALAGVSDRGTVHTRNEDAMAMGRRRTAAGRELRAAVVCDGVSTVRSPELASRAAATTALEVLLADTSPGSADDADDVEDAEQRVRAAVAEAASRVEALGDAGDRLAPSCTLVCAVVSCPPAEPGGGGGAVITVGWVGDSRAYWLASAGDGAEPSRLLTADHSWAADMIRAGLRDPEAALADRRAHAITRWLGHDGEPEPDVLSWRPTGPGALLLCTDGLWNYLPDADDLASVITAGAGASPFQLAREFTALALTAGGRDNVTTCLIPVDTPTAREAG